MMYNLVKPRINIKNSFNLDFFSYFASMIKVLVNSKIIKNGCSRRKERGDLYNPNMNNSYIVY